MAEAFLKKMAGDHFEVESAGLEKGRLNPYVVRAMAEAGIDISHNETKSVFDLFNEKRVYQIVVTVCSKEAAERCPIFPGLSEKLHWPFADPSTFAGTDGEIMAQVRQVRDQIEEAIKDFVGRHATRNMIHIDFSPASELPPAEIADNGEVSRAFFDRGIRTFQEAASYVRDLPYGFNASSDDSMILLRDGFGTCTTKHGIIARLAEEMDVPARKYEGFYPLTEAVIPDVASILEEAGIAFIPRTHCFLSYQSDFFDLTEGNCTGKKGMVQDYLKIFMVKPEQSQEEIDRCYRDYYEHLCNEDASFSRLGIDGMFEVLKKCIQKPNNFCIPR